MLRTKVGFWVPRRTRRVFTNRIPTVGILSCVPDQPARKYGTRAALCFCKALAGRTHCRTRMISSVQCVVPAFLHYNLHVDSMVDSVFRPEVHTACGPIMMVL